MHIVYRYIRSLWQLARPRTLVVIWLHLIFAYEYLSSDVPNVWVIVAALVTLAAWYVHAVAINDLSDEEADTLNLVPLGEDRDRPLINGTLQKRQTVKVAWTAAVILVTLAATIQLWIGIVAIAMIVLNIAYSLPPIRLSARGGAAQMLLPLGYVGFPAIIAVAVAGVVTPSFALAMAGLYLLFMGRLFLKDLRDETGDRQTGKRTFLVRHGIVPTLVQSGVWSAIGMALMFGAIWQQTFSDLLVVLLLCFGVILYNLYRCYKEQGLKYKLLRVAIIGRAASWWLFCVVLVVAFRFYNLSAAAEIAIIISASLMFAFGIVMLLEEHAAIKRVLVTIQPQLE